MRKKIFLLLMLAGLATVVMAQDSDNVLNVEVSGSPVAAQLGGKGAIVVVTPTDGFVVRTTSPQDGECSEGKKVGNHYEYQLLLNVDKGRVAKVVVAKKGMPVSGQSPQVMVEADKRLTLKVSEPESLLGKTNESVSGGSYFDIGKHPTKALIEINSQVKLNVQTHDSLQARHTTANRNGTYIDSIVVDVTRFSLLNDRAERLRAQYNRRFDELSALGSGKAKPEEYDKLDALEEQAMVAEGVANAIFTITLQGPGTNILTINEALVRGLRPKDKLTYGIMIAGKTDTIVKRIVETQFQTQYAELFRHADTEFQGRNYVKAADYYRMAADEKDVTPGMRMAALDKASTALRYDTIQTRAEKFAKMINDMAAGGQKVKKDLLLQAFNQAINAYQALSNSTQNDYYAQMLTKLRSEKSKVKIDLEGVVKYGELHQGMFREEVLPGSKFYGVVGSVSTSQRENVYFRNENLLATSDSKGEFSFSVAPDEYDNIIVVGAHNGKIKVNKVIPMKGRGDSKLKITFGKK